MAQSAEELKKNLVTKRGQCKSNLTRYANFIGEPNNHSKINEIKVRTEKIELDFEKFADIQSELEILDASEAKNNETEDYEKKYFNHVALAKEIIQDYESQQSQTRAQLHAQAQSQSESRTSKLNSFNLQLAPLPLPVFEGHYDKWTTFHDTFVALVHNNACFSNIQKFYHLQAALKGEASRVIDSLEITDSNYPIAFNLLIERYENKKYAIRAHMKGIFELTNVSRDSHTSLRSFLDTFLKHYRALKNFNEPVEHWHTMLLYLLTSKLDINTKKDWETKTINKVSPSIDEFTEFLKNRCQILESVDHKTQESSQKRFYNNKSQVHLATNKPIICIFCKDNHIVNHCKEFLKLTPSLRLTEIRKREACTNCLRRGHQGRDCFFGGCRICDKKHNTLLHLSKQNTSKTDNMNKTVATNEGAKVQNENRHNKSNVAQMSHTSAATQTYSHSCTASTSTADACDVASLSNKSGALVNFSYNNIFALLSTAQVYIYDKHGNPILCRALLDNGSQSCFLTEDLWQKLQLPADKIKLPVIGINAVTTDITKTVKTTIKSTVSDDKFDIQFLVINKITDNIPQYSFDSSLINISSEFKLADPTYNYSQPIEILLGCNIFYELLLSGQVKMEPNKLILQNTKLGWIIAGPFGNFKKSVKAKKLSVQCNFVSQPDIPNNLKIEEQLIAFWHVEERATKKTIFSKEEAECEQHFIDNFQRAQDGKFVVKLPFKENLSQLGESKHMATQRFQTLERKFSKDAILKERYSQFIQEYISLGHMSPIGNINESHGNRINYLPHHGVSKETSATTKLRVVFDASAKTSTNLSFNNVLKTGPCIQDSLFSILFRFRTHTVVFTADIAKMYRCVYINKHERDLQRVVWRFNPADPLLDYKLNTVTYGTAPASFLATRCLKQLAIENSIQCPNASRSIASDFYMDDWLSGANDVSAALKLINEVDPILRGAGFILRQWSSNSPAILEHLKISANNSEDNQYVIKDNENSKTLGVFWNASRDDFRFMVNKRQHNSTYFTKRVILSIISQIFDPLGLIGPVVVTAKIFLQRLWQLKELGWDDFIPNELITEWLKFYENLQILNKIEIPRQIVIENAVTVEIHCFSDASERAYGSCIYVRSANSQNETLVRLACAKSRVAPIKAISLARLELCAALLSAQLCQNVISAIKLNINQVYYWCDSTITLAWINTDSSRLKTFVSNRVAQIQTLSDPKQWRHVPTQHNAADIISRGVGPEDILNKSLWFDGPEWLCRDEQFWPKSSFSVEVKDVPDMKIKQISLITTIKNDDIISRFSSFNKLLHVVVYIYRFYNNVKVKIRSRLPEGLTTEEISQNKFSSGELTIEEIERSKMVIVHLVQDLCFRPEIESLKISNTVVRGSKLSSLDPFLDEFGTLRVGGRLQKSSLNFESKHPIILPAKHHLTTLIIRYEHTRNLHAGPQLVLAAIRCQYWPLSGRRVVRNEIRKCVNCFRIAPITVSQKMGNLPAARVTPSRPFSISSVDYAGPYLIKDSKVRNKKFIKAYVCIFVCLSTRAVHVELASELSTDSFLNIFKRFIARRGLCAQIFSDNATNFVGADNALTQFVNKCEEPHFRQYLLDNKIVWKFTPPRSPHFNGLVEAAVRQLKYHLKRVMKDVTLTYEDFYSILVQVESILNSRPMYPLTEDPDSLEALTPGHFLIGGSLISMPESVVLDNRHTRVSVYRHMKLLIQQFWANWCKDYLHTLQQRSKWRYAEDSKFLVNKLVLLKEDNTPPCNWKLARIVQTHPGDDEKVRIVTVKTRDGLCKRAVNKICVLPIETE